MPLFLDSADIQDIKRAVTLGFVAGVTTNPTLVAKTGRVGLDILQEILSLSHGPVFYQVTADTLDGRFDQAQEAQCLAPERVVIKIPATLENFTLAQRLSGHGVRVCITAVFHPAQAYLSTLVGASYAAVYVNRLSRLRGNGVDVLRECALLLNGSPTRLLAASLKTTDEVVSCLLAGVESVTLPLDLILAMAEDELSLKAIEEFNAASEK